LENYYTVIDVMYPRPHMQPDIVFTSPLLI